MISFPFDSIASGKDEETGFPVLDRAQNAEALQLYFEKMFSSGIMPNVSNCLKVSPGTGMNLLVDPGICLAGGAFGIEKSKRTLALQASDPNLDRIDAVIARKDNNTAYRNVDLYILKGTPSSSPQPPELQRESFLEKTSTIYEIALAHVFVSRGTTSISAQRITDTRLNNNYCGLSAPYAKVDATGIYDQYQASLDEWKKYVDTITRNYISAQETAFGNWFDTIKGQLDGDLAGNLQNQINMIKYWYVQEGVLYVPNTSASISEDGILTIGTEEVEVTE